MSKYSKKIVKQITTLIRADYYTIPELCSISGISESTFHYWKANKLEFSEEIKRAREVRDEKTVTAAKKSLFKLIEGFYYENTKVVYENTGKLNAEGKPIRKPKEWTVYSKYYGPRLAAIIFVLTNLEPNIWRNSFRVEVTGKNGKPLKTPIFTVTNARELLKKLSDEDLDKKMIALDKKLETVSSANCKNIEHMA